jgi:hypothetical protein
MQAVTGPLPPVLTSADEVESRTHSIAATRGLRSGPSALLRGGAPGCDTRPTPAGASPTAPVAGRALRVPAGWACGPPFPRPVQSEASRLGGRGETPRRTVRVLPRRRLDRYAAEGERRLHDRSSRPHRSPRRTAPEVEHRIVEVRRHARRGPDWLAAELEAAPDGVPGPGPPWRAPARPWRQPCGCGPRGRPSPSAVGRNLRQSHGSAKHRPGQVLQWVMGDPKPPSGRRRRLAGPGPLRPSHPAAASASAGSGLLVTVLLTGRPRARLPVPKAPDGPACYSVRTRRPLTIGSVTAP